MSAPSPRRSLQQQIAHTDAGILKLLEERTRLVTAQRRERHQHHHHSEHQVLSDTGADLAQLTALIHDSMLATDKLIHLWGKIIELTSTSADPY